MDKLPFFYYDILSRITPGAATLATFFLIREKMPPSLRSFFVDGQQNWKAVVVPLVLGGLTYVIGVLFETLDYIPGIKSVVLRSDKRAFSQAWHASFGSSRGLEGWSAEQVRRLRFHLWERLVLDCGRVSGMDTVFAHCHRFQAESKMFLHLIYPALLFAGLSLGSKQPLWWACVAVFIVVPTLFYLSYARNGRRWLQTVSFCKLLNIIDGAVELAAPKPLSNALRETHT